MIAWLKRILGRKRAAVCEGWRVTGRECENELLSAVEYIPARDMDSIEGYMREIVPLVKHAPMCVRCAAQGLKHWPFEFVIAFFDAPTKCTHARAQPTPYVGASTSSGCPDCGAVFRLGNGTWLGSAQDFGDGDGLTRE